MIGQLRKGPKKVIIPAIFFSVIVILLFLRENSAVDISVYLRKHIPLEVKYYEDKGFKAGSIINEKIPRCQSTDMNFFILNQKFDKVQPNGKNMTKESCLELCNKGKFRYAGISATKSCFCQNNLHGFITEGPCEASCSFDKAKDTSSARRLHVFEKIHCYAELTHDVIQQQFVGYVEIPQNNSLLKLRLPEPTVEQCVLNCEREGKSLAIPVRKSNLCLCSNFLSLFGTAEQMKLSQQLQSESTLLHDQLHPVYKTFTDDPLCGPKKFLAKVERPVTALISLPGSGNTWMRHLIESATGFYTGSFYNDMSLYEGGFIGEREGVSSHRTIAIKDHLLSKNLPKPYDKAILVIRDFKHACMAEFTRMQSSSHTGQIDPQRFKLPGFKHTTSNLRSLWLLEPQLIFGRLNEVLVVYFEDVVQDPIKELKKITDFLKVPGLDSNTLESRLMCTSLSLKGSFKRPPRTLTFDPYDEETRKNIRNDVEKLDSLLKSHNKSGLPSSYFKDLVLTN